MSETQRQTAFGYRRLTRRPKGAIGSLTQENEQGLRYSSLAGTERAARRHLIATVAVDTWVCIKASFVEQLAQGRGRKYFQRTFLGWLRPANPQSRDRL